MKHSELYTIQMNTVNDRTKSLKNKVRLLSGNLFINAKHYG